MKLQVMSDLHLEFDEWFRPKNAGSDVLVLSGDICVGERLCSSPASPYYSVAMMWMDFFEHCSKEWGEVVYVFGNHEYYYGTFHKVPAFIKIMLEDLKNVHVLDNESVEIDGVTFLGTTLWTDGNKGDPITENVLRGSMNDYNLIKFFDGSNYRKFQPFDTFMMHEAAKKFVFENAPLHEKVVVVGHHAPSGQSLDPMYADDHYMNGGYFSNLDYQIAEHPEIKLWTHGHMHTCSDYMIGETRVVCNPKGYNDQNKAFEPEKVFEI